MLNLDMTQMINNLCEGKATAEEQQICGITFKAMIQNKGINPIYDNNGKPHCPKCEQPLNTKLKDGKHIFEYCKCCGQHINWEES